MPAPLSDSPPIGVFDSGVGGLSILKALRAELPAEDFVYIADNGHAPYGERTDAFVLARAHAITAYLLAQHQIQVLVVACNTATAAAIHSLRQQYPQLALVGVEPALKPAVALSQTRRIGVMATRTTLASQKFKALVESLAPQARFVCRPCDGLADAIERDDTIKSIGLCIQYTMSMAPFGPNEHQIDALVLGCTHYGWVRDDLAQLLGPQIQILDNGEAVARQTRRVLKRHKSILSMGQCQLFTTGDSAVLLRAVRRWLGLAVDVIELSI